MPTALFLTHDLMITSQVSGVARANGYTLEVVRDTHRVHDAIRESTVELVIVDLQLETIPLAEFVGNIKSDSPQTHIVAFGPHVRTDLLEAAQASGCDRVMSRGQFTRELNQVFAAD